MSMTLKSAVYFGILANDRRRSELAIQAITVRNAGATKEGFREFLKELDDGD